MSVPSAVENTHVMPAAAPTNAVVDLSIESALANLKTIGDVVAGQWIYTDLASKKVIICSGWWSLLQSPQVDIPLLESSVRKVIALMSSTEESERAERSTAITFHNRISKGFDALNAVFKKYAFAEEFKRVSELWTNAKPSTEDYMKATFYIIKKTAKPVTKKTMNACIQGAPLFEKARAASRDWVLPDRVFAPPVHRAATACHSKLSNVSVKDNQELIEALARRRQVIKEKKQRAKNSRMKMV